MAKMLRDLFRYSGRVWKRAINDWLAFVRARWFLGSLAITVLTLVLYRLYYGDPGFTEQLRAALALGTAVAIVAVFVFLFQLISAPVNLEKDIICRHAKELGKRDDDIAELHKRVTAMQTALDSRDRRRRCARELSDLISVGQSILHDERNDPTTARSQWRDDVLAVLNELWPNAGRDFRTMEGRHPPGATRDSLREELAKLSGFMVSLRQDD